MVHGGARRSGTAGRGTRRSSACRRGGSVRAWSEIGAASPCGNASASICGSARRSMPRPGTAISRRGDRPRCTGELRSTSSPGCAFASGSNCGISGSKASDARNGERSIMSSIVAMSKRPLSGRGSCRLRSRGRMTPRGEVDEPAEPGALWFSASPECGGSGPSRTALRTLRSTSDVSSDFIVRLAPDNVGAAVD